VVPAHPPSLLSASKARLVFLGEDPLHTPTSYWGFRSNLLVAGALGAFARAPRRARGSRRPQASRSSVAKAWAERNENPAKSYAPGAAAGAKPQIESAWSATRLNAVPSRRRDRVDETSPIARYRAPARAPCAGGFHLGELRCLGWGSAPAGRQGRAPGPDSRRDHRRRAFFLHPVIASFGAAQELVLPCSWCCSTTPATFRRSSTLCANIQTAGGPVEAVFRPVDRPRPGLSGARPCFRGLRRDGRAPSKCARRSRAARRRRKGESRAHRNDSRAGRRLETFRRDFHSFRERG